MKREIKFRCWDSKEKEMFDLWADGESINGFFASMQEHYHPMQFTGLRDKFGKEIYESDIVMVPNYAYDPSEGDNPCNIHEVDYITNYTGFNLSEYEQSDIEVIGDVHSTPELLT